ncbi:hypothetical protein GCM10009555_017690 [Acrocarpospora macrocephala]|uniref:HTH merR-type domain-containing protein n=1 Tax=Acrocarpospora macrocephala TaxID=150177 RepID=A0A5M3WGL7_9ACTN|nr:hypothetical protein [Acrocarpospora macrocephala]GES07429.1 hypothetical protein Amac_010240 [Acrocarpospora macrocephala]
MPPALQTTQWATRADAAQRLGKARGTIASWITRYGVRKRKNRDDVMVYDYDDLAIIEWFIRIDWYGQTGEQIPATPAERARVHADTLAHT